MNTIDITTQIPPFPFFTSPVILSKVDDFAKIIDQWQPSKRTAVYIHMPFCAKFCSYCRLSRGVITNEISDFYSKNIVNYIDKFALLLNKKKCAIQALFIGGGTPTSFVPEHLERITTAIEQFTFASNAEITIESSFRNYKDVRDVVRDSRINRISFGLQIADNERCTKLGRTWNTSKCKKILDKAHADGLIISADLMYGLHGIVKTNLSESCKWLLDSPVTGVELNSFVLQSGTPLYAQRNKFAFNIKNDAIRYREFIDAVEILMDKGFRWISPCQLSRLDRNEFIYERVWHNGGDCVAVGPGVKGRIGEKWYYTNSQIEPFISNDKMGSKMLISEIRNCDSVTLFKQRAFFALLRDDIRKNLFSNTVINTLMKLDLIFEEHTEKYSLTLKGRYYISNIATYLFKNCIETRKNKRDWFKRQKE